MIRWLLIGATDPSQKKFLGDFISANEKVDEVIKGIDLGVYFEGQAPPKNLVTYEGNHGIFLNQRNV